MEREGVCVFYWLSDAFCTTANEFSLRLRFLWETQSTQLIYLVQTCFANKECPNELVHPADKFNPMNGFKRRGLKEGVQRKIAKHSKKQ